MKGGAEPGQDTHLASIHNKDMQFTKDMAGALHTPMGCHFDSSQGTKGANPKEC